VADGRDFGTCFQIDVRGRDHTQSLATVEHDQVVAAVAEIGLPLDDGACLVRPRSPSIPGPQRDAMRADGDPVRVLRRRPAGRAFELDGIAIHPSVLPASLEEIGRAHEARDEG
jgi:hypothetical protein